MTTENSKSLSYSAVVIVFLFIVMFCLSSCCQCDDDSQTFEILACEIDRPKYGDSTPSAEIRDLDTELSASIEQRVPEEDKNDG